MYPGWPPTHYVADYLKLVILLPLPPWRSDYSVSNDDGAWDAILQHCVKQTFLINIYVTYVAMFLYISRYLLLKVCVLGTLL